MYTTQCIYFCNYIRHEPIRTHSVMSLVSNELGTNSLVPKRQKVSGRNDDNDIGIIWLYVYYI